MKRNGHDQRHLVAVDRLDPEPADQPKDHRPLTVAVYLEEWLWGKQSIRPSTHLSYETHVRLYFVPHLGALALSELKPRHIERMYRELATDEDRRLSVPTLRRIHGTLMSALNLAVRRGLIERNPAATVELPRAPSRRTATWSAEELSRFLDAIHEDRLHLLCLLLGLVGMRRGEALALRWVDVDLNAGLLRIEQSLVRVGDRSVMGPPKSSSGRRVVAIDDETARRLHWHQCRQRLELLRLTGSVATPELVFTTPEGKQLDPAYLSRHFDWLVAQHGPRRIRAAEAVTIWLQPVTEPKREKLRLHLDLRPEGGDVDGEVERLLGLGATRADVGQTGEETFTVLADPEGNEFCVLHREPRRARA